MGTVLSHLCSHGSSPISSLWILTSSKWHSRVVFYSIFFFGSTGWHPEARQKGVHVAPDLGLRNRKGGSLQSCGFTLLPKNSDTDRLNLADALSGVHLPPSFLPPLSAMRIARARPLRHLTLRLSAQNWWTWTDDPSSKSILHHHLGLDPALGDGSAAINRRPTSIRMQELAQQRRNGYYPVSRSPLAKTTPGWGHIISKLSDLKRLELVFQTFTEKKAQLEKVVECAKTWRFPITDSQFELAWDGQLVEEHWNMSVSEKQGSYQEHWYDRSSGFEMRTIQFTRTRMDPGSADEDCKVH